MNVLTFEIPGVIQPQERPRFSRRGKKFVTHDAPKLAWKISRLN